LSKTTTQDNKAVILGDLWVDYKADPEFKDFIEYNDLGLPLAYAIANGIVVVEDAERVNQFINETFDLFLVALGIEDTGFETLDEMLDIGE
jgi:hypothetical protein